MNLKDWKKVFKLALKHYYKGLEFFFDDYESRSKEDQSTFRELMFRELTMIKKWLWENKQIYVTISIDGFFDEGYFFYYFISHCEPGTNKYVEDLTGSDFKT